MFCPRCRSEYIRGLTWCIDCAVPLVDDLAGDGRRDETDPATVYETTDPDLLRWASERLSTAGIPHAWGPLIPEDTAADQEYRQGLVRTELLLWADDIAPGQLRVPPEDREEALLWLANPEQARAEMLADFERYGLSEETAFGDGAEIAYCPECGEAHRGARRCADCGLALVPDPPRDPPGAQVPVFMTRDPSALDSACRRLAAAGITVEWGPLGRGSSSAEHGAGEPRMRLSLWPGSVWVRADLRAVAQRELADLIATRGWHGRGERPAAHEEPAPKRETPRPSTASGYEPDVLYCPECGGEYRPGFSLCADCGVPLVASPPSPARSRRFPAPSERSAETAEDEEPPFPGEEELTHCAVCGAPLREWGAPCEQCEAGSSDEEAF